MGTYTLVVVRERRARGAAAARQVVCCEERGGVCVCDENKQIHSAPGGVAPPPFFLPSFLLDASKRKPAKPKHAKAQFIDSTTTTRAASLFLI